MDQFVIAADATMQLPACDLLFVHGNDLTWGASEHGFFLANISIDEEFEEILQVVEARSKMSFTQLAKLIFQQFQPKLLELFRDMAPHLQVGEDDPSQAIAASLASLDLESKLGQLKGILPDILRQWPLCSDGVASWLIKGARSLYQRQLSTTGMSHETYHAMVRALDKLSICEHVVRVAYPRNGFHFELSLTGSAEFKTMLPNQDARFLDLLRLSSALTALKHGRDNALAVFISNYLNRHFIGPNQAFSCAYYGNQSEGELDVVIPALRLGFEIKLCQSPFTQTENKLQKMANDLKKQIPSYANHGCEHLYYVTNLSKELADSVLTRAHDGKGLMKVESIASGVNGGMQTLLPVLKGIGQSLNFLLENDWQRKAAQVMTTSLQSRSRRVTKKQSGSKEKPFKGRGVKRGSKRQKRQ